MGSVRSPSRLRLAARALVGAVVSIGSVVFTATAASADPAAPTNFRSSVVEVVGEVPDGFEVSVLGGDSFLRLTVPSGHTAEVPDTAAVPDGEAIGYLRFDADGIVRLNSSSFSATANESRYGTPSAGFDRAAEADWKIVSRDGSYAWHDHRIHWMSRSEPTAVAADGTVDLGGSGGGWTVPLIVDGQPVTVEGRLVMLDAPSPIPWVALASAVVVGATVLGWRRPGPLPVRLAAAVGVFAGTGALWAAWATWAAAPAGTGADVIPVVVSAIALAASMGAIALPARLHLPLLGASAATLGTWGVLRWEVLTHAVLPSNAPFVIDRAATALAIGVGTALGMLLVWRPPARG